MFGSGVLVLAFLVQLANTFIISYFFLHPFAEKVFPKNSQKAFFWLSFIRICLLALCDFLGLVFIVIITYLDIFLDFIGALIIIPLIIRFKKVDNKVQNIEKPQEEIQKPTVKITCLKCGENLKITDSKCPKCGAAFSKDNIKIGEIK